MTQSGMLGSVRGVLMVFSFVVGPYEEIHVTGRVESSNNTPGRLPTLISSTGKITIGDVLEILPFEDAVVVIEIDGATLWDALESSLSAYPSQEGHVF